MTTEERATAYAEKKMCAALDLKPDCINHTDALIPKFCGSDIEEAYLAGATEALALQWRSVDEELPSNDDKVFVIIRGAYVCGWYNQKYESWEIFGLGSYSRKNASYWMPIPPIPETNTEKK